MWMKKVGIGVGRAYIECALYEFGSLFGSLRQFWALNSQKILFLLLIGQSNHEFRWPNHRRSRRIAAAGRWATLLAIVRRVRWRRGFVVIVVMVVVVIIPSLIVRTPVRRRNSSNSVALASHSSTRTLWVPNNTDQILYIINTDPIIS